MKASHQYTVPKRALSLLLCLVLACSLLPGAVLAEGEPCADGVHAWDAGTVTVPASCTAPGVMTYACTSCGAEKTEEIPTLAHTWGEWEDTVTRDACVSDGERSRTCSVCGETEVEIIPAHNWNGGTVTTAAGCMTEGQRTYECSDCHETITEVIPPAGHAWSEWDVTAAADCETDGEQTRTCTRCNEQETEVIPAGHEWGEWTLRTAPTCTGDGQMVLICSRCQQEQTSAIPNLGHDFENGTCKRCGTELSEADKCYGENCPNEQHDWVRDWRNDNPGCAGVGTGYTAYECIFCGAKKKVSHDGTADHSYGRLAVRTARYLVLSEEEKAMCVPDSAVADDGYLNDYNHQHFPHCEKSWKVRYYCSYCNAYRDEDSPATGHDFDFDHPKTVAPTATEDGYTEYTCTGCNQIQRVKIPRLGITYTAPTLQDFYKEYGQAWVREHVYTESQVTFTDHFGTHIETPLNSPAVTVTPGKDSFGVDTFTINDWVLGSNGCCTVLYAQDLWDGRTQDAGNIPFCDIVVDTTGTDSDSFNVYLVDFGISKNAVKDYGSGNTYSYSYPTKGIRNITLIGDRINVYLVNSNLGFIDYKNAYGRYQYSVWYNNSLSSQITLKGFNSHIYMGNEGNCTRPMEVSCSVTVDAPVLDALSYDPSYGELSTDGPYSPFGYLCGKPEEFRSTVKLANMSVRYVGGNAYSEVLHGSVSYKTDDVTLSGLADVSLYKCRLDRLYWPETARITLNDFASLSLTDCTGFKQNPSTGEIDDTMPSIDLKHLSTLTLSGKVNSPITAKGKNTVLLRDADLKASILVSDEFMTDEEMEQYLSYSERESISDDSNGAALTLLLGGDSKILSSRDNNNMGMPAIMVASTGTLYIQDDPAVPGIGSVTAKSDGYWYTDSACIGGVPAEEGQTPGRHGAVNMRSGILNAESRNGSAAIGGSLDSRYSKDGGVVQVTGGVINASASYGAAAIGGADGGNGGAFIITGGTVNATATGYGMSYEGDNRYYAPGLPAAAIGGGAAKFSYNENQYHNVGFLDAEGQTSIYVKGTYSYVSGGGSGLIWIFGGVVNASAPNPGYDSNKELIGRLNGASVYSTDFYTHPTGEVGGDFTQIDSNALPQKFYVADNDPDTHGLIFTEHPWKYVYEHGNHGRWAGYVIGSSTGAREVYGDANNVFEVSAVGGLIRSDGTPVLVLRQHDAPGDGQVEYTYTPGHFYLPHSNANIQANDDQTFFQPSLIGRAAIFTVGYVEELEYNEYYGYETFSGYHYDLQHNLKENSTYRVRGQLALPDVNYSGGYLVSPENGTPYTVQRDPFTFVLPEGTVIDLLSGSTLTVAKYLNITAADPRQLMVEEGSVIQGEGRWPGKPVDPENPPSLSEVLDMMAVALTYASVPDPITGENITVYTHVGVCQTSNGYISITGNSAEEVKSKAATYGGMEVIAIFSAGSDMFRLSLDPKEEGSNVRGNSLVLYNSSGDYSNSKLSLTENGALTATPDWKAGDGNPLGFLLHDDKKGHVTVTLTSAKISTPAYTIYEHTKAGQSLILDFDVKDPKFAYTIDLGEPDDNRALFSIPSFMGSEFRVNTISPLKDQNSVRFSGKLKFTTPLCDFAGIDIDQLQIRYGDSVSLTGIAGEGHVNVPEIAGFPVSGGGSLKINTFSPHREISLSVNLMTPIFEGSFQGALKEVKGVYALDTLYAEMAVGEGGIPLVPPTTVGYLMGGGLGFEGLADTLNMDSVAVPPVRLKIAAKGSIVDVINGWVRLSLGPSGFSLDMTGMKIKNYEFIKKLGMSGSWDMGKMVVRVPDPREYYGTKADFSIYLTIGLPVPGSEKNLLLSATGTVGIGAFTGINVNKDAVSYALQKNAFGNLKASVQLPKKIVLGMFPFENISLGEVELGFYGASTLYGDLARGTDTSNIKALLKSISNNTKLNMALSLGAKLVLGGGKFPAFHVKIVYVLGDGGIRMNGGFGNGGSLFSDEEELESIPSLIEVRANTVASLDLTGSGAEEEASLMGADQVSFTNNGNGTFTAQVFPNAVGNVFLAVTASGANEENLIPGNILVTKGSDPVTLIPLDRYNEEGNMVDAQGNDNTVNFFTDPDTGTIYFAPDAEGNYTFAAQQDSGLTFTNAEAIELRPFVSLVKDETTLNSSSADYSIEDAETGKKYKVELVLGKNAGDSDFLLADSGEITAALADITGSLTFDLAGATGLPAGDYYPSIRLLEYITATDDSGNEVSTWSLMDQISLDTTLTHTNSTIPSAPGNVKLAYSGNGTMTASWNAVENADSYQIVVYDEEGTDMDMIFQVTKGENETAPATRIVMDFSSLERGKCYSIGVKAVRTVTVTTGEGEEAVTTTYEITGAEGKPTNDPVELKDSTKPVLTYSANVVRGEGINHALTVMASGGTLTVSCDRAANISVKRADGTVLAATATDEPAQTLTYTVPANGTNGTLTVLAADPVTSDYAQEYISVSYDTVAPPMVLSNLGQFILHISENGYVSHITGTAEPGASILVYREGDNNEEGVYVAGSYAGDDGAFDIPLYLKPNEYSLQYWAFAADQAGNRSAATKIAFLEAELSINLDPGSDSAACTVGIVTAVSGNPVGVLPAPYWTGAAKIFEGWYTEPEGGELVTPITVFTEDTTLYARWADSVILNYYEDGNVVNQIPVKAGQAIGTLPETRIVKPDQMFLGWYSKPSGGELITEDSRFSTDRNLYAQWTPYVTVTFSVGMGDMGSYPADELQVPVGEKIENYPEPTATGYTFRGWYWLDEDEVRHPVQSVTRYDQDTKLYAEWSRDKVTLTVTQLDGEEGKELDDPGVTWPDAAWTGEASISYARRIGNNEYDIPTTVKPTEAGQYRVTVQRDTLEAAYVGSRDFSIEPGAGNSYTLTLVSSDGGTAELNTTQASSGTIIIVTAAADPGYELSSLTYTPQGGSAQAIERNAKGDYTFLMPSKDVTVDAVFVPRTQVTVYPTTDDGQGGQAAGHITITPEGTLYAGDEVTLNAPLEAGYEFLGWYQNEERVCTDRNYTFVITEDTYLVAKYRIYGTARVVINGGSLFSINGEDNSTEIDTQYPLGTTITVAVDDSCAESFAYWKNLYGKVLSTSPSFTFTVTGEQSITAVFDNVLSGKATLVFESLYGQIMARVQLSAPGAFIVPSVPVKNGYDPLGWDYDTDGVYNVTQDTLVAAIDLGRDTVLTIHPLYTLKPMRYTVSVTDGTGSGTYNQNDLVTVTADAAPEGYKFSHWENSDRTVLSYSESYTFFADHDITLTAMYVVDTATVEAKGTTAIIDLYYNAETGKMTFVSLSTVPMDCRIDLAGVIATGDQAVGTSGENFTAESSGVRVRGDAWSGATYRYTWTVGGLNPGQTVYVRAYLVYTDANGNQQTVYSPMVSQTAP